MIELMLMSIAVMIGAYIAFDMGKVNPGSWTLFVVEDDSIALKSWRLFVNISYAIFFGAAMICIFRGSRNHTNKSDGLVLHVDDTILVSGLGKPYQLRIIKIDTDIHGGCISAMKSPENGGKFILSVYEYPLHADMGGDE